MITYVAPYIATILILAFTLIPVGFSHAATNDVGNSNSGTVTQSASDVTSTNTNTNTPTATTGASSSGANNEIKVERGAAYTAPSISRAEVGTQTMQLHSFLGGATFAETELDTRVRLKIQVIIDAYEAELIDQDTAKARIGLALNEMDSIQEERRVPVLGFSCNHRTIFNLAGMLCN